LLGRQQLRDGRLDPPGCIGQHPAVDASGRRVRTRTIHIADYSVEGGSEAIEIEVVLDSPEFFQRFA
jgi:hypothetical protein